MLYVVTVIFFITGLAYSFTPRIMPYHEQFIGMTHGQLDPLVAALFLKALRVIGGAFCALGVANFVLIKYYFSRGDNRIRWLLFVTGMLAEIPVFIVTLNVGIWPAVLVPIALLLAAFMISKPSDAATQ